MKKLLIVLLLSTSVYLIIKFGVDLYQLYFPAKPLILPPPPPPPMSMEAGPIKVVIDEATPWESIAKLVSTILFTYLGIRVINKYVK
jgi:hypothetical protein